MGMLEIVLHLNQFLGTLIAENGNMAYAILFLVVFCEMGLLPLFLLPGDPLLFFSGAFCAMGTLNIWVLIPVLFIAAVLGSALNYWIGRRIGEQVYTRNYRWLDRAALNRTHAFYEKYGGITFLMSPFIAVVRTFSPFVAGISQMTLSKFLASMMSGAVLWVVSLLIGGYYFGNIPLIRDHLSAIVLIGLALGLGSLVVSALVRAYRAGS